MKRLILYTDGGANPNPGSGGFGIHGYFIDTEKKIKQSPKPNKHYTSFIGYLEDDLKKKYEKEDFFNKKLKSKITNEIVFYNTVKHQKDIVYKNNKILEKEEDLKYIIEDIYSLSDVCKPLYYLECYGSSTDTTNNFMELYAVYRALDYSLKQDINSLVLYLDSDYVKDCIKNILRKGIFQNAANKDILIKIEKCLKELIKRKLELIIFSLKSHSGNIGNDAADRLATLGCLEAKRNITKLDNEFKIIDNKFYWKKHDYLHPLLSLNTLYCDKKKEIKEHIYNIVNNEKDSPLGKILSSTTYSIVKLEEGINIIDELVDIQYRNMDLMVPIVLSIPTIGDKNVIRDYELYGSKIFNISNNAVKYNLPVIKYLNKTIISKPLYPPKLSFNVTNRITVLHSILEDYISGVKELYYKNITNHILNYIKERSNKGYIHIKDEKIKIIIGKDLPSLNTLIKIKKKIKKITLVKRRLLYTYKYAVIIECDDCISIWSNFNSSINLL